MYRIPKDIDLQPVVGETTTQLRVGQFDLQFTFGNIGNCVNFSVQSPVMLYRNGQQIARWEAGRWPDPGFFDVMNSKVAKCDVVSDRRIRFEFENGLEMHLEDNSDYYESMQISFGNQPAFII